MLFHCCLVSTSLALSTRPTRSDIPLATGNECLPETCTSRRDALTSAMGTAAAAGTRILASTTFSPAPAAAAATAGLASRLSQGDPALLKNSVFNIPPRATVYPEFLRGDWDVQMTFRGFLFPSAAIAKDKLVANANVPGFQKLSIAHVADVGRDSTNFKMSIDRSSGLEDRQRSLATSIDAHLGYEAVREVLYDPRENANRLSVDFIPNRTRNANRIELFCNARESELVPAGSTASGRTVFVCSEYIRQVTFGLSQEFGVARQVSGNYAHFWTWRAGADGDAAGVVTGNLLTAAYLDAQDPMFFEEPSKPVVVYSHDLTAKAS